jgi:hypothetical protein
MPTGLGLDSGLATIVARFRGRATFAGGAAAVVSGVAPDSTEAAVALVASVAAAARFRGFRAGSAGAPISAAGSGAEDALADFRGALRAGALGGSAAAFRADRAGGSTGASTRAGIASDVVLSGRAFRESSGPAFRDLVLADKDSALVGGAALRVVRRVGLAVVVPVLGVGVAGLVIAGSAFGVTAVGSDAFGALGWRGA